METSKLKVCIECGSWDKFIYRTTKKWKNTGGCNNCYSYSQVIRTFASQEELIAYKVSWKLTH